MRRPGLRLAALAALAVATTATARVPARIVEPWSGTLAPARSDHALKSTVLDAHQRARAEVGLGPLEWDDALAASARRYAATLAATGRFEHDTANDQQGENLWTGTRDAYDYREMLESWVGERGLHKRAPIPHASTTGDFGDVGHYTQIVWKTTRRVGCAVVSAAADDVLVCRYFPAGNVVGQTAY